jgi:hypothetical protein
LQVICRTLHNRGKCRPEGQTPSTDACAGRFHCCNLMEELTNGKENRQSCALSPDHISKYQIQPVRIPWRAADDGGADPAQVAAEGGGDLAALEAEGEHGLHGLQPGLDHGAGAAVGHHQRGRHLPFLRSGDDDGQALPADLPGRQGACERIGGFHARYLPDGREPSTTNGREWTRIEVGIWNRQGAEDAKGTKILTADGRGWEAGFFV